MSDKNKELPFLGDFGSKEWKSKQAAYQSKQNEDQATESKSSGEGIPSQKQKKKKEQPQKTLPTIEELRSKSEEKKKEQENIPTVEELRNRSKGNNTTSSKNSACKKLESKDSTFIFIYGQGLSGKSCFLISLLNYLTQDTSGRMEPRNVQQYQKEHTALRRMYINFKKGILPKITALNTVYELDFTYTPNSPKIPAKFTFLEMSGEDLEQVHLEKAGNLSSNIDLYFNCPSVKICFILTIPYNAGNNHKWAEIDHNTLDFLNYIKRKNPNLDSSRLLCIITKWDEYNGPFKDSAKSFVKENLPMTFQRLESMGNQISAYSIGEVTRALNENTGKEIDFLLPESLNTIYPEKVKNWLYEAVTGRVISDAPWWERLFNWL